jgi:hypothetical protein
MRTVGGVRHHQHRVGWPPSIAAVAVASRARRAVPDLKRRSSATICRAPAAGFRLRAVRESGSHFLIEPLAAERRVCVRETCCLPAAPVLAAADRSTTTNSGTGASAHKRRGRASRNDRPGPSPSRQAVASSPVVAAPRSSPGQVVAKAEVPAAPRSSASVSTALGRLRGQRCASAARARRKRVWHWPLTEP